MSPALRLLLGLGLAALSGGLLVLAYPPYNLWPLAWVALLPMLLAQFWLMPARLSSLASATTMGLWGLGYFGPVFGGSGLYMEWLPPAIFLIALLGDMGVRAFHERTGYRYFVWQGVSNWVGIEMIRGFVPIAATWGFIAYTQHTQPWLIQPVSVFSIYGMSALIVLLTSSPDFSPGVPTRNFQGWSLYASIAAHLPLLHPAAPQRKQPVWVAPNGPCQTWYGHSPAA